MHGNSRPTLLVIALALAFFTAWAGHTYSALNTVLHPSWEIASATAQSHHDHGEDHTHTSLIGDHQHDVSNLVTALGMPPLIERSPRVDAISADLPVPPIFLIKRPPRSQLSS